MGRSDRETVAERVEMDHVPGLDRSMQRVNLDQPIGLDQGPKPCGPAAPENFNRGLAFVQDDPARSELGASRPTLEP